ncbi:MAG: FAD-dependent oxidoreductase [Pseudomonadota bacterium]
MDIAIIGAGLAGLTCGAELSQAGHQVSLFDKGRGPGGRMSTRRADTSIGQVRFDHGAQYITAETSEFGAQLETWAEAGHIAQWQGQFVDMSDTGSAAELEASPRWVGVPAMNGLIRALAEPFNVTWGARVQEISGTPGAWTLGFEGKTDTAGPFHSVLLAIPAEQVGALLNDLAPHMAESAAAVVSAPSWTAMFAFDTPVPCEFDAARVQSGPIGWAARNASKPGRGPEETWVVQASANWSHSHLEDSAETVTESLLEAFRELSGAPAPIHAAAHRWRYAQATETARVSHQYDPNLGLGTCGDWHLGGKCEHAWLSGRALSRAIIVAQS